jgi:MFS family permease
VKTCAASHPSSTARSTAFEIPPDEETWAPNSTRVRYPPVAGGLRARLGALSEREFRLLFSGTAVSTLGDAVADIALVFAVLEVSDSAAALGAVLAARSGMEVAGMLFGGVISDRLPRNLVLAGACTVQGVAQAATAVLVLGDTSSITAILLLQALYGAGSSVVWPAEIGLIPDTVSAPRLQQANALMGLTRDVTRVLGPAVGGALVVAGSPGVALAVDAGSFVVCGLLLVRIRTPRRNERPERSAAFFRELHDGWREFTAHSWLWGAVVFFSLAVFAYSAWLVLGPVVAEEEYGGARAWAAILVAGGVGAVIGGLLAIRVRPQRPLVASVAWLIPWVGEMIALALGAPLWLIVCVSAVGGLGLALHIALWFTVFQQRIPPETRSRVSSYEALGSLVLAPVGLVVAGPAAEAFGTDAVLWGSAALGLGSLAAVLLIPSVWAIKREPAEPGASPA